MNTHLSNPSSGKDKPVFGMINNIVDSRASVYRKKSLHAEQKRKKLTSQPQSLRLAESLLSKSPHSEIQRITTSSESQPQHGKVYSDLDTMKSKISDMQGIVYTVARPEHKPTRLTYADKYDSVQNQVGYLAIENKLNQHPVFKKNRSRQIIREQKKKEDVAVPEEKKQIKEGPAVPEFKLIPDEVDPEIMKVVPVFQNQKSTKTRSAPEFKLVPDEHGVMQIVPAVTDDSGSDKNSVTSSNGPDEDYGIGLKRSVSFNHFASRNDIADAIVNTSSVVTNINAVIRHLINQFSMHGLRNSITNAKMMILRTGAEEK